MFKRKTDHREPQQYSEETTTSNIVCSTTSATTRDENLQYRPCYNHNNKTIIQDVLYYQQQNTQSQESNVMFQRLFKRFKRNHTPPSSPALTQVVETNVSSQDPHSNEEDTVVAKECIHEQENDGDNESVHSNSSSYSDYDYLEPALSNDPKSIKSRKEDENDGHDCDDDDAATTSTSDNHHKYHRSKMSFRNSNDEELDSSSDSSYSDYDDYQYLTAVSAAVTAAARTKDTTTATATNTPKTKTYETKLLDKNQKSDDTPPSTITTTVKKNNNIAVVDHSTTINATTHRDENQHTNQQRQSVSIQTNRGSNKMNHHHHRHTKDDDDDDDVITSIALIALGRASYPDFFMESEQGVPGAIVVSDGTDSSSDEDDDATIQRKTEKYRTKEDEDVVVFMDLAKRLSLKSLLHLLKGHVQSQRDQYSTEYIKRYNAAWKQYKSQSSYSSGGSSSGILTTENEKDQTNDDDEGKGPPESIECTSSTLSLHDNKTPKRAPCRHRHRRPKPSLVKKKQFRWAEVTNDKVREVVYEIDSLKSCIDLWWQPNEMQAIRADLIETVKFYRKRRPGYIQSVEIVARHAGELYSTTTNSSSVASAVVTTDDSTDLTNHAKRTTTNNEERLRSSISYQQQILEDHMKSLMSAEHSYARGLETHIVKMLSDHRKSTVAAVIEEQNECKICDDDYETTIHCLREQSMAYSSMSTKFAYAMARCDQIDALKASMSNWNQE